jgi:hypothetical protein
MTYRNLAGQTRYETRVATIPGFATQSALKRRKEYAENPEKFRTMKNERCARVRSDLQAYKMERGCTDCGYNAHPSALDFDHRPGTEKCFNIMSKGISMSSEKLWDEVAKCEVVCANCHRIRTTERIHEAA